MNLMTSEGTELHTSLSAVFMQIVCWNPVIFVFLPVLCIKQTFQKEHSSLLSWSCRLRVLCIVSMLCSSSPPPASPIDANVVVYFMLSSTPPGRRNGCACHIDLSMYEVLSFLVLLLQRRPPNRLSSRNSSRNSSSSSTRKITEMGKPAKTGTKPKLTSDDHPGKEEQRWRRPSGHSDTAKACVDISGLPGVYRRRPLLRKSNFG